jgi:metallophosphoesterase (TIGR00282 family)
VPVAVLNLQGRVFMPEVDDPFRTVRAEVEALRERARVIVLDFHAEATSEKIAMGWYLDGKISALVGTHTHVQTADERILPEGTAYITDVGMTGPRDGVIGMDRARILERFQTGLPVRFEVATGPAQLNAVAIDVDEETGMARRIERILEVDGRTD